MGAIGNAVQSFGNNAANLVGGRGTVAGDYAGGVASLFSGDLGHVMPAGLQAGGLENTFSAAPAAVPQQDLSGQIAGSQAGFNALQPQQQALSQALLNQSQGQGPNPAQQQLQQATNRNIQQGTGMIASQKGINAGLAGRQAAQMTGAANQQAAGQGALMGAQQQIAAQGQLGGMYGQMGQQQLGYQQTLQNALAQQNQTAMQGQIAPMEANARVAAGNAQQRGQMAGGLLGALGSLGGAALMASHGAYVGGHAEVPGDSPLNDTVSAKLSPGEIVIPRSKANDPDAAKAFVEHILAAKKKRKA